MALENGVETRWTDARECTVNSDCVLHQWTIECAAQNGSHGFCPVVMHRDSVEAYDAVVLDVAAMLCRQTPDECFSAADCVTEIATCSGNVCVGVEAD